MIRRAIPAAIRGRIPERVKADRSHTFRDVVAGLGLPRSTRVLDFGAGGFVGEVTTRHLVRLFDPPPTAVEHHPERAAALAERFGDEVVVVTGDAFAYTPPEPVGLLVADLDSALVPEVFERLLPRAEELLVPGGVVVTAFVKDLIVAYSGPNALPVEGATITAEFLKQLTGRLRVDPESLGQALAPYGFDLVGLYDKYQDDPLCFMAWLVMRRRQARQPSGAAANGTPSKAEPSKPAEPSLIARIRERVGQDYAAEVRELAQAGAAVSLDLVSDRATCDTSCVRHIAKWGDWARTAFHGTLPLDDVFPAEARARLGAAEPDADTELIVPGIAMALLRTDRDEDAYMAAIGAKSRNMVRKAQRLGYEGGPFDYNEHLDDLHAINTSKPVRSGGPMAESYLQPPTPIAPDATTCARHRSAWIGVRREGRLLAYSRLVYVNELAVVDRILGHGDALPDGVMNLLTLELFRQAAATGAVRAINYLTLHSSTEQLDRFKRSVGYEDLVPLLRVARVAG